jgi:predicted ATPase/DNA-binding CsgD family transcriptional regulator
MTDATRPEDSQHGGPGQGRSTGVAAGGLPVWIGRRPAYLTAIVGREEEAAAVRALLLRENVRLVTLTGPAGVGKTRLSVLVATSLECGFDEIAMVDLAPVREPGRVVATVGQVLGVPESPRAPPAEAVADRFRHRRLLLVLDNFEQVLPGGPHLVDLLVACPGVTALVTSRALLRVSGEHVVAVSPLELPDTAAPVPVSRLGEFEAVRLFVERARAVRPSFTLTEENASTVVGICRRLDGLPLAIELAAARVTVLPPHALLDRLSRRLSLLTEGGHDVPERLRTMRAGIAWSYELLRPPEQALFRRVAVFAGGFTLAAAEFVGSEGPPSTLETVTALVDQSLLQQTTSDGDDPRFAMLETLREYALEQLAAHGEEDAARRAHAAYFRRLAEDAEPGLRGADQQRWRDRLEDDLDNLRTALGWATGGSASPEDSANGLRLAGALWYFWFQRGLPGEGRQWLTRALARTPERGPDAAQALLGAGTLAWRQGDFAAARVHLDESVTLWRGTTDRRGLAEALHVLGHVQFDQRDFAAARVLFEESLDAYRQAEDTPGSLPLVADLGLVAYHRGDHAAAGAVFEESLALFRRHGLKDRVAGVLNLQGDLARLADDGARATALYEESLALWRELRGTPGIASALHKLGQVKRSAGDIAGARSDLLESLALQRELGNAQGIGECLAALAGTVAAAGRPERATRILAAGVAQLEAIGVPLAPADHAALTRDLAATRVRLGIPAWERACAAGRALSADDAVALALLDDSATTVARSAAPGHREPVPTPLSRREREVTALVARGLSNREIAAALSIAEKTVANHIDHVMTKLDLRSRTRIAVWALEHGLGRTSAD